MGSPSQVDINKEDSFYFAPKNWAILTFSALKRAILGLNHIMHG
jgi:hypothetical protein